MAATSCHHHHSPPGSAIDTQPSTSSVTALICITAFQLSTNLKDYLRTADPEVYDWVDSYVPAEEDWSDLEATLAYLDTDSIASELEMFLASYNDENWSDAGHNDFQYEVDRVASGLSRNLQARFGDWIRSIFFIPDLANVETLFQGLDRSAAFLTFNYTSTLTKISILARKVKAELGTRTLA
nr:AbiH family protein [Pseudomonas cichorii]